MFIGLKKYNFLLARAGRVMLVMFLFASILVPVNQPKALAVAAQPVSQLAGLALAFVAGSASLDQYTAVGAEGTLSFEDRIVSLALPESAAFQVRFLGASEAVRLIPSDVQAGVVNRYHGSNPSGWQIGLKTYAALTYANLYPGVHLRYEGQAGQLKGTYLVTSGSSTDTIRWEYAGVQRVKQESATGDLLIETVEGRQIREQAPVAWQTRWGQRVPVDVQYSLNGDQVSFQVGEYDASLPLVIDPTLVYGTYLGAGSTDDIMGLAVDQQGNVIVTGETYSANFPGSTGNRKGSTDIFISKLDAQGKTLLYTTILAGNDNDKGVDIAVDAQGEVWLTGETWSSDFPLVDPIHPADFSSGFIEGFAAKLSSTGQILFASMIGLTGNDEPKAIALDPLGNAYITGEGRAQYGPEVFVAKFSANTSTQEYLVVFGAAERGFDKGSSGRDIAVDAQGNAYITGRTNSIVFPVQNAFQAACAEDDTIDCTSDDAFVTKINAAGTEIIFSTYLGGNSQGSNTGTGSDEGQAIAVDSDGNVYVAGQTFSPNFPLKNAFQASPGGLENFTDAFLTKLTPEGNALVYSTYLGGFDWEEVHGLAVDGNGNAYLGGLTSSNNYPVSGDALQPVIGPGVCLVGSTERYCYDGFISVFNSAGSMSWGSYLGGSDDDMIRDLKLFGDSLIIGGKAESWDFPTTAGAFQPTKALEDDGFIVKISFSGTAEPPPGGVYAIFIPILHR